MHTFLAELIAVVHGEIDLYRQLFVLIRRERGRIVRGELAGLIELVRRKESIATELAEVEASRTRLLACIAAEYGKDSSTMTLSWIAAAAPGEHGDTLRALLVEFRGVVGQLVAANDVNRTLLGRSLEFVQGSLDIFRSVVGGPPTYSAGGRFNGATHPVAVLNETA
jgi:flagellar biosynthesis/type III secretory pathway chaperone